MRDVGTGRRKIYYGWWLLAGSVVAMAIGSGVSFWSFGLYIGPLEDQFGWSRAEVTLGFSLSLLVSGLLAPLVGRWIDSQGPRRVILAGAILTSLTYLLLALTDSLWQWYVFLTINAVFRQMMFFMPFQALISRWFDRRRGIAVGILATGFSLGGFIVVPVMRVVIDAVDWDGSFIFSAILITVVFVPLGVLLVRNRPEDVGAYIDGERSPAASGRRVVAVVGLTVRQVMRLPLFWLIAFALMFFFYGMFGWMVHAVPFYESVGVSPGWAAALVSIAAGGGIFSRLAFGFLADQIRRIEAASVVLALFLGAAMLTLLATDGSLAGLTLFVLLWLVGSGGGPMLEPLLLTRAFGVRYFASILGAVAVVETTGQIISPTAAGAIFDRTGSYDWALVMFASAMGISLVLFWLASRLPWPEMPAAEPIDAPDPPGGLPLVGRQIGQRRGGAVEAEAGSGGGC